MTTEKFWIRRNVCAVCEGKTESEAEPDMAELTLDEIINGDGGVSLFGLNHCIRRHLNSVGCQVDRAEPTTMFHEPEITEPAAKLFMNNAGGPPRRLFPVCYSYVSSLPLQGPTRDRLERYLAFVGARASGKLLTTAAWMRKQVISLSIRP